ncbi:MAG: aminopeptidase P family protein [Ignavibacteriales bacterium]|nr:aminopeptidase P family protein [Ignavibacteriales bacterium]
MSKEMVMEKINQAVQILNEKGIDMWITFVRETGIIPEPMRDIIIGTNCTWQSAFIITRTGDTYAIVGSLEVPNMKIVGTYRNVIGYLKSIKENLIEVIDKHNPEKIAINFSRNSSLADGLTYGMYLELISHLRSTDYVDKLVSSEEIIAALRGRKSTLEITYLKEAVSETIKIFEEVGRFMKPGLTEKQVAAYMQNVTKQKGFGLSWEKEYCPSVFTGPDTAGAHSGPTDRQIKKGHVLNIDFGIKFKGYCSDLQRTWYFLNEKEDVPPETVIRGFNVIKEAIQLAAKELKPGKLGWEIDDIARQYIIRSGYEEYPHALGHQIGRVAHDGGGALLAPKWERYGNLPFIPVEEGQVFTIEPRLTIKDYGIATIEEEVIITKNGCEFISPLQKEIFLIKSE